MDSPHTGQLTKCCVKCLDICKNSRQQTKCKHGRERSKCKDCGGSQICEHYKIKSQCKDCGGSQVYEHGKIKSQCNDCGGSQICEHNKQRSECPTSDPPGHLAGVVQSRVYTALKDDKEMSSTDT